MFGEIKENDDKVRTVYGGSVEQAAYRNLARSFAPKPGRVPKPGRRSHVEARPGRVRRSLAAGRVPKPGRARVTARRGPARPGTARPGPAQPRGEVRSGPAGPSAARPGPARAGRGRDTGKTDSTTVEITCACRRMTDRARRFANFWKQIEKNDSVLPVYGGSVCESRKTAKFDAPVDLLGRVSRTGSNYDSLEEAQWPCASFCQLSENRGKRQSPIRLRGISWGNENFCLNLFQQSSVPCRAVPCRAVPCRAVPCRAVPCRAVPCRPVGKRRE